MTDDLTPADVTYLRGAIDLARRSRRRGNHPFGALLVDADGVAVAEAENTVVSEQDVTGHAETNLVRIASRRFDRAYLRSCTLYTSTEPCAMCSGAIYWSGIGRVIYGLSEAGLLKLTGSHPENPAHPGACGKTQVVRQNVRPKPEPAESGIREVRLLSERAVHG